MSDYMNNYMKNRYQQRRTLAIETLGGYCVLCGDTEELEIDHIDPSTKSFEFSKLWNIALPRFMEELKKCQLLCYTCHKLKSNKELSVGHGEGKSGKRNCPCTLCKKRKAEYMRNYNRGR